MYFPQQGCISSLRSKSILEAFEGAKPLFPTAPLSTPYIWPGPSSALYFAFLTAPLCLFTPCSPAGTQFIQFSLRNTSKCWQLCRKHYHCLTSASLQAGKRKRVWLLIFILISFFVHRNYATSVGVPNIYLSMKTLIQQECCSSQWKDLGCNLSQANFSMLWFAFYLGYLWDRGLTFSLQSTMHIYGTRKLVLLLTPV